MEQIAEYGVAAHFAYAEAGKTTVISDKQADWIHRLQNIVQEFQTIEDKEWFKQHLNVEILEKNIFVYTPKGDIIELPHHSTILDFAFRVHTDIWLRFKSAFINGRIVPIDYTLNTWDIVDIKTFKTKISATPSREKYLHTPTAKTKLTRYIRQTEKEQMLSKIESAINTRLLSFGLPGLWTKQDLLTKHFSTTDRESTLRQIHDKQISINKFLKIVYKEHIEAHELEEKEQKKLKKSLNTVKKNVSQTHITPLIIDLDKELDVILCPACKPSSRNKSKIIAKSDKQMMKVHCVDCAALDTVKSDKLYEAHWKNKPITKYTVWFDMKVKDKSWNLLKLLEVFEFFQLSVNNVSTGSSDEKWRRRVQLDVDIPNISRIDFLMKELAAKESFIKDVMKKIF